MRLASSALIMALVAPFVVPDTVAAAARADAMAAQVQPPKIVQPGAPGKPSREIDAEAATDTRGVRYTPADVAFMQGMLAHHAQAIQMTALVATRTHDTAITRLAARITASQADEMAMMREWLARRGKTVPDAHAHHQGQPGALMPGMLTPEQMAELGASKDEVFDKRFLAGMIRHHEGALVMVHDLLQRPGAGQEPELFAFVSDVEADQGMEIRRMGRMLGERTR